MRITPSMTLTVTQHDCSVCIRVGGAHGPRHQMNVNCSRLVPLARVDTHVMDFRRVACHCEHAVHGRPLLSGCPVNVDRRMHVFARGRGLSPLCGGWGHIAEAQRITKTIPADHHGRARRLWEMV